MVTKWQQMIRNYNKMVTIGSKIVANGNNANKMVTMLTKW